VLTAPGVGKASQSSECPSGFRIASASRAMLVRQSTSVPNTSKNSALGVCMPCPFAGSCYNPRVE
jgi:hypothetical protein